MSDQAAEYRKRADECRRQAHSTPDVDIQRQYLELMEGWLKLAVHIEQQWRDEK